MTAYIEALPEECLVRILSLTSLEDVIRSSAVSKKFYSAAISDYIWKNFLPSDYDQIIRDSSSPRRSRSLKDLFLNLYREHILIDDDTKSISLDKRSRKKCFMLGSRSLTIAWSDNPRYWSWISEPKSRFLYNAKLENVCWLHIKGVLPAKLLSKNTSYGIYFVFKLTSDWTGFQAPIQISLSEVDEDGLPLDYGQTMSSKSVYLDPPEDIDSESKDAIVPIKREDGWMEIQMGTYQVTDSETVFLEMNLRETEVLNWKSSLLIQGIEFRPLID